MDKNEVANGYAIAEDTYVILDDEEIEGIKLETKKTLDLQNL